MNFRIQASILETFQKPVILDMKMALSAMWRLRWMMPPSSPLSSELDGDKLDGSGPGGRTSRLGINTTEAGIG